ncbi:AAA family ATPase [Streptomyces cellulosae]
MQNSQEAAVRVASLTLENFQGVQRLHLTGLSDLPLIVIAGRNGTGKSTALFAMSLLWELPNEFNPYALVGPWGDTAWVEMEISLTDEERQSLTEAAHTLSRSGNTTDLAEDEECPATLRLGLRMTEYGAPQQTENNIWTRILRSKNFRRTHSFAQLTFIPSERSISRSDLGSVDPDSLSSDATERIRTEAVESILNKWANFSLNNIPDYLATLDYAAMITARQEGYEQVTRSEYDEISDSFHEATGKTLEHPSLSREGRISIFVDSMNGNKHSVQLLSSGELEALGLMYLTRRLASAGGVLAVDEPEIHLHPALQTTILDMIRGASESSQLWLCTHSPNLINSSPVDSLVSISAAGNEINQAARVNQEVERIELLADLGVTPSSWLQHDRIIIVEGSTDKNFIEQLFPVEASRSVIYVAGSRSGVDATVRTLADGQDVLPWIAIRDKDLVGNSGETSDRSFTWSRRTFENTFLDPDLLSHVITSVGQHATPESVEAELRRLAEPEREEVEKLLIEEELNQITPDSKPERGDLKSELQHHIALVQKRLDAYQDTAEKVRRFLDAKWDADWKALVQGKRVLAKFIQHTPFRSYTHLLTAICKACRENPWLMSDDLQALRQLISEVESS